MIECVISSINKILHRNYTQSRTREGATTAFAAAWFRQRVSIHAPVKVRQFCYQTVGRSPVSIHAPVKVRQAVKGILYLIESFNSRTREGATLPRENAIK